MTLRIWWVFITILHIEQGQTLVTLRKGIKRPKPPTAERALRCYCTVWSRLKTKVNDIWEGQEGEMDRHVGIHYQAWKKWV